MSGKKTTYSSIKNKKRLVSLLYGALLIFAFLIGRIAYLAFIQGEWLMEKAENQWTSDSLVSAERGSILDRNGNVLAVSANADTVVLRPPQIKNAELVATKLSEILNMDRDTVLKKAKDSTKKEIWLKRQVDRETANKIRALDLDGVAFITDVKRYYPNNEYLAQVIGFTSTDGEGLEGIELKYNKYLNGQNGRIVAETDKNGVELPYGKEIIVEAQDGYDIYLTVDEVLQSYLENAVKLAYEQNDAKGAYGIVVDPNTCEILALSIAPSYDLNNVPRNDLEVLQELSRNKIITDIYEPGSTFKIITTAAALDSGTVDLDSTFNCSGSKLVDGERIKCWRTLAHGHQDLTHAVMNSCNPCFMEMALSMGTDKFYEYIEAFGFGKKTGVDLTGEQAGIVTNSKYVKNVDLARIGFGQAIAVTPIQLISAVSAAINGGNLYTPHIVSKYVNEDGETIKEFGSELVRRVISEETSEKLRGILEKVVSEGSGKNGGVAGYKVGGKTGTAQKYENGAIVLDKHISSFIGFAPADKPELLVLIVVDEADVAVDFGSIVAAPYVSMFLNDALRYMNIEPTEKAEKEMMKVPDVRGMTLSEAQSALKSAGFNYLADGTGTVVKQSITPDSSAEKNTTVLLYMQTKNKQNRLVSVPDVSGLSILDAKKKLANLGLTIEAQGSGIAFMQKPAAGEKVAAGSSVKVMFEPKNKDPEPSVEPQNSPGD